MKTDQPEIGSPTRVSDGVWCVRNRIFSSNTYICDTDIPGRCVVIDPGLDGEAIALSLHELQLLPSAIVCTHGHFDHIGSASLLQEQYGVEVHLHSGDIKLAKSANFLLMLAQLEVRIVTPTFQPFEGPSGRLPLDGCELEFVNIPGHTDGSCYFLARGCAFVGDTLYHNSVDADSQKQGRRAALVASLRLLWDRLPSSTLILPGHGPAGRFSEIRVDNREFRQICETPEQPQGDGNAV